MALRQDFDGRFNACGEACDVCLFHFVWQFDFETVDRPREQGIQFKANPCWAEF